jgi:hypothetical protein
MNREDQAPDVLDSQEGVHPLSPAGPVGGSNSTDHSPISTSSAGAIKGKTSRTEYRWSKAARDLVQAHVRTSGAELSGVITRLVEESGYPRWACWRFARRMGIRSKRVQRRWTEAEQQRLEKLLDLHPVNQIAKILRRSQSSVWHMLYRMGASAAMARDGFTKYTLAVALHVSPIQVEDWINRGWLSAREVQTGRIKRSVIAAEDFCRFCKEHTSDAVGNRLIKERLDFVYHFAFPLSHAELLSVRESKKERNAYQEQLRQEQLEDDDKAEFRPDVEDEQDDAFDRIA